VTYTPNDDEMTGWIDQHIYARVQNSNCHHIKTRGQWMIKAGLTKLANKHYTSLEKILALDIPEDVEKVIKGEITCDLVERLNAFKGDDKSEEKSADVEATASKEEDNTAYYVMAAAAVGMIGLGAWVWNKKK